MTWRGIKEECKTLVHDHFKVKAHYHTSPDAPITEVNVRVHYQEVYYGDIQGSNFEGIQSAEMDCSLIFDLSEISEVDDGAYVTISEKEIYRVNDVFLTDINWVKANAVRLLKGQEKPWFTYP